MASGESLVLDYLVARDHRRSPQQTGSGEPGFWCEVAALEEICRGRDTPIRARRLPLTLGGQLSGVLFDLSLPTTGDDGYVAALDAVCRLAHDMKVRRSELLTADILERPERMLEKSTIHA